MAKYLWAGILLTSLLPVSGAALSSTLPRIAVYRGDAGCDDCSETVRRSIENRESTRWNTSGRMSRWMLHLKI